MIRVGSRVLSRDGRILRAVWKLLPARLRAYILRRVATQVPSTNMRAIRDHLIAATTTVVEAPLILISQVQRSGGTLLSQLFDGHRQVLAHPNELRIRRPDWPPIDPSASAARNFKYLYEADTRGFLRGGYRKGKQSEERHTFLLPPFLQRELFLSLWERTRPTTQRDILNLYFTAYFGAWLNRRNGELADKLLVTAFAPRFLYRDANVDSFFAAYPDGALITFIRDPFNWYPSARDRDPLKWYPSARSHVKPDQFGKLHTTLDYWKLSATKALRAKRQYGQSCIVLRFDDLVSRTKSVMVMLSKRLGIEFDPILLQPTFNGIPIAPNSSFPIEGTRGVMRSVLERSALLTAAERETIQRECGDLFDQVLSIADRVPGGD